MSDAERIRMLEAAVIELLDRLSELEWRVLPFEAHPPVMRRGRGR